MKRFIVHYDYGTGSTYLGVLANSEDEIIAHLAEVRVVDPSAVQHLTEKEIQLVLKKARPLDDPIWNDVRKR